MTGKIGRVRYSEARGVLVREQENVNEVHSAIYGDLFVYTDSSTEAHLIIKNWTEIVQAVNRKVSEILSEE